MYEKNKKTFQKILFFIADSSFYLQLTFKLKAQKGGKKLANENLHKAKEAKNDEFYTQLYDVSEELRHYKEHFKDKIIFKSDWVRAPIQRIGTSWFARAIMTSGR